MTTKKPTGLTITRNGNKFTFEWKIADKDYEAGQQLEWYLEAKNYESTLGTATDTGTIGNANTGMIGTSKWNPISISKTTTKKTVSIDLADYFPTVEVKFKYIIFRVRGRRKQYSEGSGDKRKTYTPDWSAWSSKTWTPDAPSVPSLKAELSSDYANVTKFTWSLNNDITLPKMLYDFQWQSRLVKDCTETDGSKLSWSSTKLGWQSGTDRASSGSASGSKTITEDTTLLAGGSYTRWLRVRARGAAGKSEWKYSKHVYAQTNKAKISDTSVTSSGGTTTVTTEWTAQSNAAHPIDATTVEYFIGTPAVGLAVPQGASWTEANVSKDTKGTDTAKFTIGNTVGLDQCLWVRVKTEHDSNMKYSNPELTKCGKLTAPTNLSVTPNSSTYRAVVTAQNNSAVPDSKLAIIFRQKDQKDKYIGIIAHGETSATVQCPEWESVNDISFGVVAYQGSENSTKKGDLYTYKLEANMHSDKVFDGGTVPGEPTNVTCTQTETKGEVALKWGWSWTQANSAEISWSQNPNAWESTAEPQTYTITNLNEGFWRVSGLETGVTWYFRVRLANINNDTASYGPYSDAVSMDLASAPAVPVLTLSDGVIAKDSSVTAAWVYVTTDDTPQAFAEICQLETVNNQLSYANIIAHVTGDQHISIDAAEAGWTAGNSYDLCVRVMSESGKESEWSDPVTIHVAEPLTCSIEATSLVEQTIVIDYNAETEAETIAGDFTDLLINADTFAAAFNYTPGTYAFIIREGVWKYMPGGNIVGFGRVGYMTLDDPVDIDPQDFGMYASETTGAFAVTLTTDPETVTINTLTEMPLTATVEGAGDGGTTTLIIERLYEYQMERPDGDPRDGYEGETIAIVTQTGEDPMTVTDLIGALDDGAYYRLIAMVEDDMGQTASESIDFVVRWDHQAGMPDGAVSTNGMVCAITPIAPEEYDDGDVCDIYRISVDKPELIVKDGEFGTVYIDPYPAIGEGRGYRIVHRTINGDYITATNQPAWTDLIDKAVIEEYSIIIDFAGETAILPFNINLTNHWNKDFKVTSYLGGAQQGDWNPVSTRTATYTVVLLADTDGDKIAILRKLADYHGICHIRTPEGSSYACNINISENNVFSDGYKVNYTITATRIDPETLDGLTFEEWSST